MRIELTVRIASRTRIPEGVMTGQESGWCRLERPGLVCKLAGAALAGYHHVAGGAFAGMPHDDGDRSLRRGHSRPVA